MTGWSPISISARSVPLCLTQDRVLAATLGPDDGSQTPTTEGPGWDLLFVEYCHRSHESCQGSLQYHTSQGCFWIRQHPAHDGQGTSLRLLRPGVPCSTFMYGQDSMASKLDYVELGLACADVCRALDRGMNQRQTNELSRSVYEAIGELTT